jgi:hypothetical protein
MLFSFTWLVVVIVALSLAGANIVGFWKCQRGMFMTPLFCLISVSFIWLMLTDAKEKIAGFLIQRL